MVERDLAICLGEMQDLMENGGEKERMATEKKENGKEKKKKCVNMMIYIILTPLE